MKKFPNPRFSAGLERRGRGGGSLGEGVRGQGAPPPLAGMNIEAKPWGLPPPFPAPTPDQFLSVRHETYQRAKIADFPGKPNPLEGLVLGGAQYSGINGRC